jgi:hypothetical protein
LNFKNNSSEKTFETVCNAALPLEYRPREETLKSNGQNGEEVRGFIKKNLIILVLGN